MADSGASVVAGQLHQVPPLEVYLVKKKRPERREPSFSWNTRTFDRQTVLISVLPWLGTKKKPPRPYLGRDKKGPERRALAAR